MMILKTVCLFVIITCTGCMSEKYWYNKDNTYQSAKSDCTECLYQAEREIFLAAEQQKEDGSPAKSGKISGQTLFENCMKQKGYTKTIEHKLDYDIRKGFFESGGKQYNIAGK